MRSWILIASATLMALALLASHVVGAPVIGGALMVAASIVAGSDIAIRAWRLLRIRQISIELLVTVAAAGALVIGEYWEAAAVTFLFMLGAWLEARTMRRTRGALRQLLDAAPAVALVVRGDEVVEVAASDVAVGETVLIKPGQRVPVDGDVTDGWAAVDESSITGEAIPVEKSHGSRVHAGTIAHGGLLHVRATGIGADTVLARIIHRVEAAQEERAPLQRSIDRFARWYTPAILLLAALTLLVTRDLRIALTLLVVGCPGALVISAPVSLVAGIGRAARSGILIKGGAHLESVGRINTLALDNTGMLTEGRPRIAEVVALGAGAVSRDVSDNVLSLVTAATAVTDDSSTTWSAVRGGAHGGSWGAEPAAPNDGERDVLRWAAIAEVGSSHPLGKPIVEAARRLGMTPVPPDEMEEYPGLGVRASHEGREIVVGSRRLLEKLGIPLGDEAWARLSDLRARGHAPVLVAVDGVLAGILGLADSVRSEAAPALLRLSRLGVDRVVMLTGAAREAAERVSGELGIHDVYAELLPGEKLDHIRELRAAGYHVAMVGDGVNDAPALAAADTSIAMGAAGSDLAIETADIALLADDLGKIGEAIEISRATLANMRENLVIALITVGVLLAGVLTGNVHMAGGMLIHQLSVLAVIANGMRLLRPSRVPAPAW